MLGHQPEHGERPFLVGRLTADRDYRRRVETAERLGIPRSKLEGREPATVTEYEYDEQGRVVRSVAVAEPSWTEQDYAEVLALGEYRDTLCPCCGLPAVKVNGHERDFPGVVVARTKCWARETMVLSQSVWENGLTENGKKPLPASARAVMWGMRLK